MNHQSFHTPAKHYIEEAQGRGTVLHMDGLGGIDHPAPEVYVLEDACLLGEYGLIACNHNGGVRIISESDLYSNIGLAIHSAAQQDLRTDPPVRKNGSYLALHGIWCWGFWHWVMEFLVKVIMAESCGFTGYYILPRGLSFAPASLEILGVAPHRMVYPDGKAWWVERLYAPGLVKGYELEYYPWFMEQLREKFLKAAIHPSSPHEHVYISRNTQGRGRTVVNEDQLARLLDDYGFKRVVMEELSLKEQVGIVARARCLIGPHGAGMTHCLFMPPGSLVLELFAPTFINPCMLPVVDYLKHRYFMVPSNVNEKPYPHGQNIEASIHTIDVTLKRELSL